VTPARVLSNSFAPGEVVVVAIVIPPTVVQRTARWI